MGNVINISSIAGNRPFPNRAALSTFKAALSMLTQNTALELASHHIRVNAISPGTVPYDESTIYENSIIEKIPLKRAGKSKDVANATVFLSSEEASWITGQILTVDGGQSLSF